jgi:hypothetical protein
MVFRGGDGQITPFHALTDGWTGPGPMGMPARDPGRCRDGRKALTLLTRRRRKGRLWRAGGGSADQPRFPHQCRGGPEELVQFGILQGQGSGVPVAHSGPAWGACTPRERGATLDWLAAAAGSH